MMAGENQLVLREFVVKVRCQGPGRPFCPKAREPLVEERKKLGAFV